MEKRMVFPDLIGNERIRSLFADALKREGAAHAYVLEGPRGSGRHTAARQIAAASLCENRRDPSYPLPCGRCASCTYPDAPCRFPEELYHSLEGYGFNVSELAGQAGIRYMNGPSTVTFLGAVLYGTPEE